MAIGMDNTQAKFLEQVPVKLEELNRKSLQI